jgi:uncharacterized membrane protein
LVLFAAGVLIVITGGAVWWLNRQRIPTDPVAQSSPADTLIQEIARLDERFEKGKIHREEYERERAKLKDEAARLLK